MVARGWICIQLPSLVPIKHRIPPPIFSNNSESAPLSARKSADFMLIYWIIFILEVKGTVSRDFGPLFIW